MKNIFILILLTALAGCNDYNPKPLKARVADLESNVVLLTGLVDDLSQAQNEPLCFEFPFVGATLRPAVVYPEGENRFVVVSIDYSHDRVALRTFDLLGQSQHSWLAINPESNQLSVLAISGGVFDSACIS